MLVDGDKVAVRSSVKGFPTQDGGEQPMLIEIFRADNGRLAEMWGIAQGLPLEIFRTDTVAG